MRQNLERQAVSSSLERTRRAADHVTACFGCIALASLLCLALASCGGGGDAGATAVPVAQPQPQASAPVVTSGPPRATTLNASLSNPWGLAFLPDGRMLISERPGSMVILSADGATKSAPISGVPAVVARGQGGLLDVVLDPDFDVATNPWIYFTYAEAGTGSQADFYGTAVARARLVGNALQGVEVIFRQLPKIQAAENHYGARLVFRSDKTLFVALGERQLGDPAQDLGGHLGKVVRINRDGSVPADNPSLGIGARREIWSYGHRNPQGAALHPTTGELWVAEHGPQGGDELNIARSGLNYGWPIRSYGCNYGAPVGNTCRVGGGTHAPDYVEPVSYWVPTSIAPSGLTFYTGTRFPEWQGNALLGALAGTALWRVALNSNGEETARERLFGDLRERIRCVKQGPDGWVYLLTDSGKLIRIER